MLLVNCIIRGCLLIYYRNGRDWNYFIVSLVFYFRLENGIFLLDGIDVYFFSVKVKLL